MVARILTGKSIRGLINYNESKVEMGTALPILANQFGLDIEQLELRHKVARFEHLTKLNSRIKTNAIHIMLNFGRSENLDVEKLQAIATDYMQRVGFGDQPFLVYKHEDASHPHLHIVTTNVKADATRIDLHNIGKTLSETARKQIEMEYKLVRAEGRGSEQAILPIKISGAAYGQRETKRSIYNVVTQVLRSYRFTSLAEYNAVLQVFNVTADRGAKDSVMFQQGGLVYSILDESGNRIGIPFKASSLAGRPILKKIESKFAINLEKRKGFVAPIKTIILKALETKRQLNKNELINNLEKQGISLVFRQNIEGRVYGITYVDHNSRSVFNGSDLGKSFSAAAVLAKLSEGNLQDEKLVYIPSNKIKEHIRGAEIHLANSMSSNTGLLNFLFEKPVQETIASMEAKRKKKKKKGRSMTHDL